MMTKPTFNDPVFVRVDNTTTIKASVVEWNDAADLGRMSVRLSNGNESVLVSADDWATLVSCVNRELERCS